MSPTISRPHPVPYDASITVIQEDSHTYSISVHGDHVSTINLFGGSMYAAAMKGLRTHFSTTLLDLNQPHTMDSKIEFLRPAVPGTLTFSVEDVKKGKQFTITHFTLSQAGKKVMVGHATNANLLSPTPTTIEIDLPLMPASPPINFAHLSEGVDPNWILYRRRYSPTTLLKSWTHIDRALPIHGAPDSRSSDLWLRPANPRERFTNDWLAYIADYWTRAGENYASDSPYSDAAMVKTGIRQRDEGWYGREWDDNFDRTYVSSGFEGAFLYPTINMSLGVRKLLPDEGVEWLILRAEAKMVRDGRTTTEVVIRDVDLEVVAISHQLGLVVPYERRNAAPAGSVGGAANTPSSRKSGNSKL